MRITLLEESVYERGPLWGSESISEGERVWLNAWTLVKKNTKMENIRHMWVSLYVFVRVWTSVRDLHCLVIVQIMRMNYNITKMHVSSFLVHR